ncbi:MAG TPA: hypothetical protein VGZ52_12960 [Acidimicrobiales bacterium]|jgi:hypothetical protein|nr:hypothetical protein [Acidimicrobiales bacterium]
MDPGATTPLTVTRIQPYQSRKPYLCPGCNQEIPHGTGHVVVVPDEAADLRRHWHHVGWRMRHRRRPGS